MSSKVSLIAEARTISGKGPARELRRNGKIPAVMYGKNQNTVEFSVSEHELSKLYHKAGYTSLLIDIDMNGKKYQVIPRAVGLHPVTDKIEHADFMYVNKDAKVKVLVHIHFVNKEKSIGIKRGGNLNVIKHDIELLCSPQDIPSRIDIDIATLDIGSNIHMKDLKIPANATIIGIEQNLTIATLTGRGGKSEATEEAVTEEKK